jgi:hypothetical protein
MTRTYLLFQALKTLARVCGASLRKLAPRRFHRAMDVAAVEPPQAVCLPLEASACTEADVTRWLYVRASLRYAALHRARRAARAASCAE